MTNDNKFIPANQHDNLEKDQTLQYFTSIRLQEPEYDKFIVEDFGLLVEIISFYEYEY